MPTLPITKQFLRASTRQKLAAIPLAVQRDLSKALVQTLLADARLAAPSTLLAFSPMPEAGEPNILPFAAHTLASGGRLCFPSVDWQSQTMAAVRVGDLGTDLVFDPDAPIPNLRQPRNGLQPVDLSEIDLVLVPGLAFDRLGTRLGRGKGFYDRFLSDPRLRAIRCGVAFECQVLAAGQRVPADAHDLPMHALATERSLTWF